ncbi:MAG: organoarsenical effux MFS transporter ArsJ [Planctomycetes bacterium]|nr:organoarsenical effux MFS transporter ArsJ [Planctomycetota bacterium]
MPSSPRRDYALVTACYQAFTLSDGALRMLVLLHLHALGNTPLALALVLLPYEVAGVVTNVLGGWLGARFGLKVALLLGLALQVLACGLLAADAARLTVPYVMATQVLSGIAKDLAKTGAKSYVRQLAPEAAPGSLFRLVAVLTGSKNAVKGLGFFVGGALLATAGFRWTNVGLAALLAAAAVIAWRTLPRATGKPRVPLRSLFAHAPAIHWLAAARLFLFGSRDVWFAIALPLFLASTLQWSPALVGAFLSAWVIGYGIVQVSAPALVRPTSLAGGARRTRLATASLLLPLGGTVLALHLGAPVAATLVVGLCAYGALFAITSSLHSWLVVGLAGHDNVAERVGFYYAANATGRLAGTLASGWLYATWQPGVSGLVACLWAAAGAVLVATACTAAVAARS